MSILNTIAAKLAVFANAVVSAAVEEGKELAGKVAVDVTDSFEDLVEKVGEAATKFVTDLFADDSLSGLEKANLAATQLAQHAAENGITIAEQDISALIKSAYLAVKTKIASL
jgi:hypothetical protein